MSVDKSLSLSIFLLAKQNGLTVTEPNIDEKDESLIVAEIRYFISLLVDSLNVWFNFATPI